MSDRIQITAPSNTTNHPFGMWWDTHVGETFEVIRLRDGIPRQFEVDVSHLPDMPGSRTSAFVPEAYVRRLRADTANTRDDPDAKADMAERRAECALIGHDPMRIIRAVSELSIVICRRCGESLAEDASTQ